jgi:hypothetical protein
MPAVADGEKESESKLKVSREDVLGTRVRYARRHTPFSEALSHLSA